jgi:hypothetical protein
MREEMGVFDNIAIRPDRTQRRSGQLSLANTLAGLALILPLLLMGAGQSFAETGEVPPDRSVSTSPTDLTEAASGDRQPETAPSTNDPPLTRAATQRHIDEMSPTRWLSRYGSVSIGQLE